MTQADVLGAVLAGGQSRRMGRDKALLTLHGKPLIEHVSEVLRQVFAEVIVVSGRKEEYAFLGLPVIPDLIADCGPLGGMHAALSYAGGRPVFIASCDLPFINADLIRFVVNYRGEKGSGPLARLPLHDGRLHPLCGWYDPRCLPLVKKTILEQILRVIDFLEHINMVHVPVERSESFYRENLFQNVNTPQDYAKIGQP